MYKRQRPNKQVCTFLFQRKDFAAGRAYGIIILLIKGRKRCLINNATYWEGERGAATFAMVLLQPKVRWLAPSIRKTNLYFISLVKKYGLGLQVHQQSCLMATLGEPFSRFIRNFWVEVRCDWLSGTAGDSVSESEDFLPWWVLEAFLYTNEKTHQIVFKIGATLLILLLLVFG